MNIRTQEPCLFSMNLRGLGWAFVFFFSIINCTTKLTANAIQRSLNASATDSLRIQCYGQSQNIFRKKHQVRLYS